MSLLRVNCLHNSLKASTPNESPITAHHCPEVIGASLKSDCIPGINSTSNVRAVTNTICSYSSVQAISLSLISIRMQQRGLNQSMR